MAINSELNADRLADLIYAISNNTDNVKTRQEQIDTLISLFSETTGSNIEVVDFDPALVFDMDRIYNEHTQSGAITFTFSGTVAGTTSKVRIVSDGSAISFPAGTKIYQDPGSISFTSGTTYDLHFTYGHGGVTVNMAKVFVTT